MIFHRITLIAFAASLVAVLAAREVIACTGITLKARDGAVVYGRTMEWGSFDLNSQVVIYPRGYKFTAHTPDKKPGMAWQGPYGFVGLDGLDAEVTLDGMNERGLAVGGFYHPGFAEYQKYDPEKAGQSMGPGDVIAYLLSTCATVDEARVAISKVYVTPVIAPVIAIPPPAHFIVVEPGGKAIVIEYLKGELVIFDAPLGVITNSPSYDWHETNLRNYLNLSAVALPSKKLEDMNFAPLGGGSGMIGLPGDFTPPSRFVRAVAFTQSARKTADGPETVYELFRILDNFNVPLGAAEGEGEATTRGMRSSTLWTTGWDTKNKALYYHTQNNRRVRKVDLTELNFAEGREKIRFPLDKEKVQDIEDVTPASK
ncbi:MULTISPECIES: linear amide C-N hydrolase [Tautonia]|uniref:linear amide C-N hydrolase n=1 Tax=Tautonia TaxID=2680020 RepID=UPI00126132B6|nr:MULTISPECIES: choloylglycine hydrolase family protein [Tautonia]